MDYDISLHTCIKYIGFLVYDDGCHLRRYANNPVRKELTPATKKLASIEIVVDKMHMKGHTDEWCRRNCDPNKYTELDKVSNTFSICCNERRLIVHKTL